MQVKYDEFDALFSVVKQGLCSHVDAVFGWCDQFQRERLSSEYEINWFNWVYVDHKRIGMLCFKPYDNAIHIHLLVVFPEFQNQKFGEMIMNHVHQLAQEQGRSRVTLSSFACNEPAIKFYKSLGYQVSDSDENFLSMSRQVLS
ncbi:GNAT family N-acetyltransferase [Saccharospirillum sp.]|uniref:GNAT family N-acetyltransferase n=1 Tax=Saccharospirillum sp. TaxID=2033801 RepID=UPI0034A00D3C